MEIESKVMAKIPEQDTKRYESLTRAYHEAFGPADLEYFSSPGRTELSGNHTDHNFGLVLAGAINLDTIACASKADGIVEIVSEGYREKFVVDLSEMDVVKLTEFGTTNALIRGTAVRFKQLGYNIGGFKAAISSQVLPGSGLSSSASIEVLIGQMFSSFYNNDSIPPEELAKIGQYAENVFFQKPCGLMDQTACAIGGLLAIDFAEPANPVITRIPFDFEKAGFGVAIVHCGGSHANLTDEYASIPAEMKAVARELGAEVCRNIDALEFLKNLPSLRKKLGDRAVLRVFHFINENKRVNQQVEALQDNNFPLFLKLVAESGNSSYKYLQNIIPAGVYMQQPLAVALALSEVFIQKHGTGASRVHGGGFAGTIQCILPTDTLDAYKQFMEQQLGVNSVQLINIRNTGVIHYAN